MNDDPTNLLETPAATGIQDAPAAPAAANPLAEQVYQQLKNDIFSFRLFPGDRFSENGIAQHYGVSRTPMRDGLFRLQREGYLEVGFRRGWKVAPINFDQLDQLYDLRIVLEVAAVERLGAGGAGAHAALEALKAVWCVEPGLTRERSGEDVRHGRELSPPTGRRHRQCGNAARA